MARRSLRRRGLLVALSALGGVASCSDILKFSHGSPGLCRTTSDCSVGEACADGECRNEPSGGSASKTTTGGAREGGADTGGVGAVGSNLGSDSGGHGGDVENDSGVGANGGDWEGNAGALGVGAGGVSGAGGEQPGGAGGYAGEDTSAGAGGIGGEHGGAGTGGVLADGGAANGGEGFGGDGVGGGGGTGGASECEAEPWSCAPSTYIKAPNPDAGDAFGYAIALFGETLAVAARYEDSDATQVDGDQADDSVENAGAAYVLPHHDGTWLQRAYVKPPDTALANNFGSSIALEQDRLVVGATGTQIGGAAYVFSRNNETWSFDAILKASNVGSGDDFGNKVAVSGDTIAVSAYFEDGASSGINGDETTNSKGNSGAVYVFRRDGSSWEHEAYLKAASSGKGDWFGGALALDGDTLVAGSRFEDSGAVGIDGIADDESALDSGAAYVFSRSGNVWTQQAYLKASNPEAGDNFGMWTALDGDTLVVGARNEDSSTTGVNGDQDDNSAPESGAAYVFVRNGTTWTQQAYLKASNTASNALFGARVALRGDTLLVGAISEDGGATGVDGNQLDASKPNSGAVYVFKRSGGNWTQQHYLKASNTGEDDQFGYSIALYGETIVISADGEASAAAGVNGDQTSDSANGAGAVYVFP
jgi:hypothetical protein